MTKTTTLIPWTVRDTHRTPSPSLPPPTPPPQLLLARLVMITNCCGHGLQINMSIYQYYRQYISFALRWKCVIYAVYLYCTYLSKYTCIFIHTLQSIFFWSSPHLIYIYIYKNIYCKLFQNCCLLSTPPTPSPSGVVNIYASSSLKLTH